MQEMPKNYEILIFEIYVTIILTHEWAMAKENETVLAQCPLIHHNPSPAAAGPMGSAFSHCNLKLLNEQLKYYYQVGRRWTRGGRSRTLRRFTCRTAEPKSLDCFCLFIHFLPRSACVFFPFIPHSSTKSYSLLYLFRLSLLYVSWFISDLHQR